MCSWNLPALLVALLAALYCRSSVQRVRRWRLSYRAAVRGPSLYRWGESKRPGAQIKDRR
eukprot:2961377-Rhodomonas_salina.1